MINKKIIIKTIFVILNVILFIYFNFFNKVNLVKKSSVLIISSLIVLTILSIAIIYLLNSIYDNINKLIDFTDLFSFITNTITFLLIITTFVLFNGKVVGPSMEPTLYQNNRVVANRNINSLKKDDIVVYSSNDEYIIKRVFGLENDLLEIKNNKLYINNELLIDKNNVEYIINSDHKLYLELKESNFKYTLKKDELILLGDNANRSTDSRQKGIIYNEQIVGKVVWWF